MTSTVVVYLEIAAQIEAVIHRFTIECWTLFSIGVSSTILRTLARANKVGFKCLQADDYLAWVGMVSSIPFMCAESKYVRVHA